MPKALNHFRFSRCALAFFLLVPPLSFLGCAGYQLGNRSLYRPDIRTIYMPMIQSDSLRRNLGERLAEAVVKDIELNTPYKIVQSSDADSTLDIRLLDDRKRVLVETRTDEPRDVEIGLRLVATWVDRRGQPLMQRSAIPVPGSLVEIGQDVSFVPEAGQSVATAQQESLQRLATQVRTAMQIFW